MTRLRPFLAALFALTLALTGVGLGVAQGKAPAAGQVVICSGQTVTTITVDADGNPVEETHLCPDAGLLLAVAAATPAPAPASLRFVAPALPVPQAGPTVPPAETPPARAPPFPVV